MAVADFVLGKVRLLRLTRFIGVLVIAYLSTCLGAGILN